MTRDPAVRALHALHLAPGELERATTAGSIVRCVWPPKTCDGAVVGLAAAGEVVGEARLERVSCDARGVSWHFGPVTSYAHPLPLPSRRRGMASPMPLAPLGTLTPPRANAFEW